MTDAPKPRDVRGALRTMDMELLRTDGRFIFDENLEHWRELQSRWVTELRGTVDQLSGDQNLVFLSVTDDQEKESRSILLPVSVLPRGPIRPGQKIEIRIIFEPPE
ncbi:hypothetical protein HY523_01815 [Candidatus Berkelbacteria bacterium]|nr:hypothetical protein [Candidatus Berkelbacteria bacterium]